MDTTMVSVGKPAKIDHSLFGKVRYDSNASTTRLTLSFKGARVASHKTMDADLLKYGILDVAAPTAVRRKMADLDDTLIALVIKNIPMWFAKGAVEPSTIDEFYKRSIVTTSSGSALRFKVQREACMLAKGSYDLVLRCKGLRFFKHVFILEWELVSARPTTSATHRSKREPATPLFAEEDMPSNGCGAATEPDDADRDGESDADIAPTWEETRALELWRAAEDAKESLARRQDALSARARALAEIQSDLDASWPAVLDPKEHLEAIRARLSGLSGGVVDDVDVGGEA